MKNPREAKYIESYLLRKSFASMLVPGSLTTTLCHFFNEKKYYFLSLLPLFSHLKNELTATLTTSTDHQQLHSKETSNRILCGIPFLNCLLQGFCTFSNSFKSFYKFISVRQFINTKCVQQLRFTVRHIHDCILLAGK